MSLPGSSIRRYSTSSVALILANISPAAGVLFLEWRIGEILLLFWAESAVIGVYNLAKMWVIDRLRSLFAGIFFMVHYGLFMAVHLAFIFSLFPDEFGFLGDASSFRDPHLVYLLLALVALFFSHGVSFYSNFLGDREYEGRSATSQMSEPYNRIIVIHVTILLDGFLILFIAAGEFWLLMLMIVLKIVVDLWAHRKQRPTVLKLR